MDDSHHFVFLIDQVPVRFYGGAADEPTARTLRRQEAETQELGLALWRATLGHALSVRAADNTPDPSRGLAGYVTTYQGIAAAP